MTGNMQMMSSVAVHLCELGEVAFALIVSSPKQDPRLPFQADLNAFCWCHFILG